MPHIIGKFLFRPISKFQLLVPVGILKASSCSAQGFQAKSRRTAALGSRHGARTLFHGLYGPTATGGLEKRQSQKKNERKQSFQRDSKQLLLRKPQNVCFSLIPSCSGFNVSQTTAFLIIDLKSASFIHQYTWTPSSSDQWSDCQ